MGETADAMIDGQFDYITGEYIGPGVGYPRTINGKIYKRKRGQRFFRTGGFSDQEKINGVHMWLEDKGVLNQQARIDIVKIWYTEKNPTHPNKKWFSRACILIQEDFPEFMNWYKQNYK